MWIVRFEMVSPIDHPEHYVDEKPVTALADVGPADWKAVAVSHRERPSAVAQFRGLKELCRQGELVRNVKLRPVTDLSPTDWEHVSDLLAEQAQALEAEVAAEALLDQQDRGGSQHQRRPQSPQDGPEGTPGHLAYPTRQ